MIKAKVKAAIVAISAIDDDFTIGLPPEADVIADPRSALEYLSCEDYHDWIRQAYAPKNARQCRLRVMVYCVKQKCKV